MPRPVKEKPYLPITKTREPEVRSWGNALISALSNLFMEIGVRLNGSIHKDGEVAMEAPFVLGTFTMADLPAASDWPWAIVVVTDGAGGRHFRGSDGTDWLVLDSFDPVLGNGRTPIFSDFTCYVNGTTGSDSYDGTSATDDGDGVGPFATIQKGIDTVAQLDLQIYDAYIQVADDTYPDPIVLKTLVGAGTCFIVGNTGTPANVLIDSTSTDAIGGSYVGDYNIAGFKIQTTGNHCIRTIGKSSALAYSSIDFGACGFTHVRSISSFIAVNGGYDISAGCSVHWLSQDHGFIRPVFSGTITLSGTPAFSRAFAVSTVGGGINVNSGGVSFSGSATGKRYEADGLGLVWTNGGGATYLPGDAAGTTATGGQYV